MFEPFGREFRSHFGAGLALLGLGAAAIGAPEWTAMLPPVWRAPAALAIPGAALVLAAAAYLCSGLVALERARGGVGVPFGEWPQALVVFGAVATAGYGLFAAWSDASNVDAATSLRVAGGALILCAFPLLVLERVQAGESEARSPDAPLLARLTRLPLFAFVAIGSTMILRSADFAFATWIELAVMAVVALVAVELTLRAAATFFVPFAPLDQRKAVPDSFVAGLLGAGSGSLVRFNAAVKNQFGIDLSRSQALSFLWRALPAAIGALALGAWALTGLTATGVAERHVYERLGEPVAVLGPGLHVHLPWPLGIMRPVELGVVHEVAIVSSADARTYAADIPPAEAPAPASADRLWDGNHPGEASYLLASESNGGQGFQIANVDLRVVYRIGLSDAAALQSAYSIEDPEALLRAQTGRLLARFFARNTLLDLLGRSQATFAEDFRRDLQNELDGLNCGLEAISIIVEAIHPPAGAANAYHEVQAAEISARSRVSTERGEAARSEKAAERAALLNRDDAAAAAAENAGKAKTDSVLFDGDRAAYKNAGAPYLMERLFEQLSAGLAKSETIIVDHRLKGAAAPTLDLRAFAMPGGVSAPEREDRDGPSEGSSPGEED